jgi:hypothetical protein
VGLTIWTDFAKSKNNIVLGHFEANSVQIAHRNVDGTRVDPPSMRVEGDPVGQEPNGTLVLRSSHEVMRTIVPGVLDCCLNYG